MKQLHFSWEMASDFAFKYKPREVTKQVTLKVS